jgi:molybdopterin molybdotransferase
MITISEAKNIIEQYKPALEAVEIDIKDALGYVISESIESPVSSPAFDNSAMDGFGVRWEDVQMAGKQNPVILKIVGESRAGIPYSVELKNGEAIRISTGAAITDGVDTVVPIEDTDYDESRVSILNIKGKGQNIRYAGEDFNRGSKILNKGTLLNPPQLALLASVGIHNVNVYKCPSIAVITTGSELVSFYEEPSEGQIRDSNSIMIINALKCSGAVNITHRQIGDSLEVTKATINELSKDNRIIILCGGVSVGLHDYVRNAAELAGYKERFWKVSQKPGKPFFFATKDDHFLFGLPGNPVSAYMVYTYYIHPFILYLRGLEFKWRIVSARLSKSYTNIGSRTILARVRLSKPEVLPREAEVLENQASHIITSISSSDGFIIVEGKQTVEENKIVEVYLFPGIF